MYMILPHDQHHHPLGFQYMNPPAPVQYTQTQPYHGIKRSAPQDEVEASTHISSHFKKLRLKDKNATERRSLPPTHTEPSTIDRAVASRPAHAPSSASYVSLTQHKNVHQPQNEDFMPVDDTPNRVYIADLDREIAEIEADESRLNATSSTFFLPDVDKNISRIPQNVLRQGFDDAVGSAPGGSNEQALVLYRDPISISVPEEEDAVRKAIIQTRKEAREKIKQQHEREVQSYRTSTGMNGVDSKVRIAMCTNGDEVHMHDSLDDDDDDNDDAMEL